MFGSDNNLIFSVFLLFICYLLDLTIYLFSFLSFLFMYLYIYLLHLSTSVFSVVSNFKFFVLSEPSPINAKAATQGFYSAEHVFLHYNAE